MILIHVSLGSASLSTKTTFLSLFLCTGRLSLTKQWRGFGGRVIKVNFFTFFLCGDCEALLMRTSCLCALHERPFSFFKSQRFEMWAVLGLGQGWPSSSLGWGLCSCLYCLWPWPVNNLSPTSEAGGPQFWLQGGKRSECLCGSLLA